MLKLIKIDSILFKFQLGLDTNALIQRQLVQYPELGPREAYKEESERK